MFLVAKLLNIFLAYKFYQQYLLEYLMSIDYNIEFYRVNDLFIINIDFCFPLQTRRMKQLGT